MSCPSREFAFRGLFLKGAMRTLIMPYIENRVVLVFGEEFSEKLVAEIKLSGINFKVKLVHILN